MKNEQNTNQDATVTELKAQNAELLAALQAITEAYAGAVDGKRIRYNGYLVMHAKKAMARAKGVAQ